MRDYNWNMETDVVQGTVSGKEELKQWIQRMLMTERNMFPQYSDQYGIEFHPLRGQRPQIVAVHLKKSIEEAILVREEVQSVEDFNFQVEGDKLLLSFVVRTIYGNWNQEVERSL